MASALRTVPLSPPAHALATIPVVVMLRNEKSWKTIWNTAVDGPSAARDVLECRPTTAVSTRDMSGSASRDPSAGMASAMTSSSSSLPKMGFLPARDPERSIDGETRTRGSLPARPTGARS